MCRSPNWSYIYIYIYIYALYWELINDSQEDLYFVRWSDWTFIVCLLKHFLATTDGRVSRPWLKLDDSLLDSSLKTWISSSFSTTVTFPTTTSFSTTISFPTISSFSHVVAYVSVVINDGDEINGNMLTSFSLEHATQLFVTFLLFQII